MGEILRLWSGSFYRLMIGSGTNGVFAWFNLSQVTPNQITSELQMWQAILGIVGAVVAIVYGAFQINLTIKRTKLAKMKIKDDK